MAQDEIDAFVTFYESWKQNGVGEDGLPLYEQVVMLRKAKPPLLMVEDPATEDDIEYFHDAYRLFQKTRTVHDLSVKGYPLALWPVISPTELQTLITRDIITVEQLATYAGKKNTTMPATIIELAKRAQKLLDMQGKVGKFEAIIHELEAQRDALMVELKEANLTIATQANMLRSKAA